MICVLTGCIEAYSFLNHLGPTGGNWVFLDSKMVIVLESTEEASVYMVADLLDLLDLLYLLMVLSNEMAKFDNLIRCANSDSDSRSL